MSGSGGFYTSLYSGDNIHVCTTEVMLFSFVVRFCSLPPFLHQNMAWLHPNIASFITKF